MVASKQVKVDNWGIFFLQRLQQFYNKSSYCDLTLQFEDNKQIQVHRLVMNACTGYFQNLEQSCSVEKDCIRMPSNLPSDVVIPIINFMYSGILEFHESSFDKLYTTAKLMNMSVLTKLLDAQKTPIKFIPKKVQSSTPITWNLQNKKITKTYIDSSLPETLPGRKLPIWKRTSIPTNIPFLGSNNYDNYSSKVIKSTSDEPPKPTRFEWPEEDSNFDSSFDDISYESKPMILPAFVAEKSPKPSTSTSFEEIKKTAVAVKRSASPIGNQCKKVNIQDVKEYLKEHKIRSDYIDYDDSEAADNDLQSFDNEDSNDEHSKEATDITQSNEETPNKSILKVDTSASPSNKHVRFSLDDKENSEKKQPIVPDSQKTSLKKDPPDVSKHTKIITEVLKKYPHLVKNNKNIRLKILAKGANIPTVKTSPVKTITPAKQEKLSYMVVKPDSNQKSSNQTLEKEQSSWVCTNCEEPQTFTAYHIYRQHLTDVHNAKPDLQMCAICGHTSRKQNMLVYHKYIKHNIQPPAMYNFPKCKECSYVALSPVVLQKHMVTHSTTASATCNDCKASFPNKSALSSHLQQTGHGQEKFVPQWNCSFCDKRFFSENIFNSHLKRCHKDQVKTTSNNTNETNDENTDIKLKDKIKIISDVKVSTLPHQGFQVKNALDKIKIVNQNQEPSSEAEALSNVASGIAASLGLVDTIVVLDDNQFILQSSPHGNIQQNILNPSNNEYILPDMQINEMTSNINQIGQSVTLPADGNAVITQSLHKTGITSTDELVMVLTDHDYSDGTNNAVITDNNIVVLYSHPVQTQAGTMMITQDSGMIEVDKNYAQTIPVTLAGETAHCEESIEMIQQEINNQFDPSIQMEQNIQQNIGETTYHVENIDIQQNIEDNNQEIMEIDAKNDEMHVAQQTNDIYRETEIKDNNVVHQMPENIVSEKLTQIIQTETSLNITESPNEPTLSTDYSNLEQNVENFQNNILQTVENVTNAISSLEKLNTTHLQTEENVQNLEPESEIENINETAESKNNSEINAMVESLPEIDLKIKFVSEENVMEIEHSTIQEQIQIDMPVQDPNLIVIQNQDPEQLSMEVEENQQIEMEVQDSKELEIQVEERIQLEVKEPNQLGIQAEEPNQLVIQVEEPNQLSMQVDESNQLDIQVEEPDQLGVQIDEPNQLGIHVEEPNQLGIQIDEPNQLDIQVEEPNQLGSQVEQPHQLGIQVEEPNQLGMQVEEPNQLGIQVEEPNQLGIQVDEPNQLGIQVEEPNQLGIQVEEPNQLGIQVEEPDQLNIQDEDSKQLDRKVEEPDQLGIQVEEPNQLDIQVEESNQHEMQIEESQQLDIQEETHCIQIQEPNQLEVPLVEPKQLSIQNEPNLLNIQVQESNLPVEESHQIGAQVEDTNTQIQEPNQDISTPEISNLPESEQISENNVNKEEILSNEQDVPSEENLANKIQELSHLQNRGTVSNIEEEVFTETIVLSKQNENTVDCTHLETNPESTQTVNENNKDKDEIIDESQLLLQNERISKILDDWDDGDTDSQQSFSKSQPQEVENTSSINKLIDDWDDEEDT